MPSIRLSIPNLDKDNARRFEAVVAGVEGVERADTWKGKAEVFLRDAAARPLLVAALCDAGFDVTKAGHDDGVLAERQDKDPHVHRVFISGMTCRSCELTIERKFRRLPGVASVDADASRGVVTIVSDGACPDEDMMRRALAGHEYRVRGMAHGAGARDGERPSFPRIVALFAAVLVLGAMMKRLGLFGQGYSIGGSTNFAAALLIGLVAGSSSCMAVAGGLLLSSAAKFNERYGHRSLAGRMRPVFLFVGGRTASYAVLGGAIGALGAALSPSPLVMGAFTVFAALYMLVMGLDMLKLAPSWLLGLMPRMPKRLSHRLLDSDGNEHPAMPVLLGAATFFLPCGFTQALQLYALATGSFWTGATVLGGFALGTVPALVALGLASTALKGRAGKIFFQFAGALVIVLGVWNVQNGFTIAGYPLSFPSLPSLSRSVEKDDGAAAALPSADGVQVIRMTVGGDGGAYDPDSFTVRAGVPVRWEIQGEEVGGCLAALVARKFGVNILLKPGPNVVEFTPTQPGRYTFSCSMGMFRGTINVVSS